MATVAEGAATLRVEPGRIAEALSLRGEGMPYRLAAVAQE